MFVLKMKMIKIVIEWNYFKNTAFNLSCGGASTFWDMLYKFIFVFDEVGFKLPAQSHGCKFMKRNKIFIFFLKLLLHAKG